MLAVAGDPLAGLDGERRRWAQAAVDAVRRDRLRELVCALVDVPSPTGDERPLAELAVAELRSAGVPARLQVLDDRQANALGRLPGDGTGADLLLYAPVDTLTVGTEQEDLPWIGPRLEDHMRPSARVDGALVTGLGAGNPKGHAACVLAAVEAVAHAVAEAGLPLQGDLLAGLGAGGMPTNARPGARPGTGHGVGCRFLLEQGGWADVAVIAKPGWAVAHEEVGLAWFDVTVGGTHTYVGSRHRLPYKSAIAAAGAFVQDAEEWFQEYAAAHTDGSVAPQGVVARIEGGWDRTAAVTPASCRLRIDLRLSPRTTPTAARREFGAFVARWRAQHPGVPVDHEMSVAVPGTTSDPASFVCRSAGAAWEAVEGRAHEEQTGTSGATDANILRSAGIPTARIGMPKPAQAGGDFALGMNACDVDDMVVLTTLLVRVAVDTCTRPAEEVLR